MNGNVPDIIHYTILPRVIGYKCAYFIWTRLIKSYDVLLTLKVAWLTGVDQQTHLTAVLFFRGWRELPFFSFVYIFVVLKYYKTAYIHVNREKLWWIRYQQNRLKLSISGDSILFLIFHLHSIQVIFIICHYMTEFVLLK